MIVEFPKLGWSFTVNRVAFRLFGLDIYWYAVIIAAGFLLALIYGLRLAKKSGLDENRFLDVIIVSTLAAFIGARLYYVIPKLDEFHSFADVINIRNGGMGIYGGVITAFVVGYFMCRWRKVPVGTAFDIASLGFLIGQGVGRWGNFVNQEAFGANTTLPWGMYSDNTYLYLAENAESLRRIGVEVNPSLPVHPCFLYESLWCILGFVLLHFLFKKRRFGGEVFLCYGIWYGLGRFFIEGLRTDSLMTLSGNFRLSQVVAAVAVIVCAVLLVIGRKRHPKRQPGEAEAYTPVFAGAAGPDEPAGEDTPAKAEAEPAAQEEKEQDEPEEEKESGEE